MIDVETGLAILARQRPIFHSEADFKHAFAWQLQLQDPDARIRLEYRPLPEVPLHLDLWVEHAGSAIAIELKYPTRHIACDHDGEHFSVYDHAAQPPHRYDFVKDIERLERVVSARSQVVGYAIMLTNDSAYWAPTHNSGSVGHAFRLHNEALLTGTLAWATHTSVGTMKGREQPLQLTGKYPLTWRDYSRVGEPGQQYRNFRALVVYVPPNQTI